MGSFLSALLTNVFTFAIEILNFLGACVGSYIPFAGTIFSALAMLLMVAYFFGRTFIDIVTVAVPSFIRCYMYIRNTVASVTNFINSNVSLTLARVFPPLMTCWNKTMVCIEKNFYFVSFPLVAQVVFFFLRRLRAIVYHLGIGLGKSFPFLLLFTVLSWLWYFIGYRYFLSIEQNPGKYSDIIALYWNAATDVANFFTGSINAIGTIINPMLPLVWSFQVSVFSLGKLMYDFITTAVGLSDVFYTVPISFQAITSDSTSLSGIGSIVQGAGRRFLEMYNETRNHTLEEDFYEGIQLIENITTTGRLLQQQTTQDFFGEPSDAVLSVSKSAYAITLSTVVVIAAGLNILFDVMYIILEVLLKIILDVGVPFWTVVINLLTGGTCFYADPGCYVRHLFNPLTKTLLIGDIECTASDFSGTTVPCICSTSSGGPFPGLPPCPPPTYTCVSSTTAEGTLIWSQYSSGSSIPLSSSPDKQKACKKSYPSQTGGRRARRFLAVTTDKENVSFLPPSSPPYHENGGDGCYFTCEVNKGPLKDDTWMFEICQGLKVYKGKCDPNPKAHINGPVYHPLTTDERMREYMKYKKLFGKNNRVSFIDRKKEQQQQQQQNDTTTMINMYSKEMFFRMLEEIENEIKHQHTDDGCAGANFETPPTFNDMMFSFLCLTRKTMPVKRFKNNNINTNDFSHYIRPFQNIAEKQQGSIIQNMESFHGDLLEAHKKFMGSSSSSLKDKKPFSAKDSIFTHLFIKQNGAVKDGKKRRSLQTNTDNLGVFSLGGACTGQGLLACPSGNPPCAPDNDLGNCKASDKVEVEYILLLLPYYISTFFASIDIVSYFNDAVECYSDISTNPDLNPASVKNMISISALAAATGEFRLPPNVKLCPGMLPFIPRVPTIAWDWYTFLRDVCGEKLINNSPYQRCNCPQFFIGPDSTDYFSMFLPGLPFAVYPRLWNTYKAFQILWTYVIPDWFSNLWGSFIYIFCGTSQSQYCSELLGVFNHLYALDGMTDAESVFCIVLVTGSIWYTVCFILFPFFIISSYFTPCIWAIVSLVLGPVLWLVMSFLIFLSSIENRYEIVYRVEPDNKKHDDIVVTVPIEGEEVERKEEKRTNFTRLMGSLKTSSLSFFKEYENMIIQDEKNQT